MLEALTRHVVQRLARECRSTLHRFFGHEAQRAFQQRGLACRTAALDQHGQRTRQQATGAGQVAHQLVHPFPHQATGFVVLEDAVQAGVDLPRAAWLRFAAARSSPVLPVRGCPADSRISCSWQCFQLEQQAAHVLLDRCLVAVEFGRCFFDEQLALPGYVQVQGIHVHQFTPLDQQVHPQPLTAQLFPGPARASGDRQAVQVSEFVLSARSGSAVVDAVMGRPLKRVEKR